MIATCSQSRQVRHRPSIAVASSSFIGNGICLRSLRMQAGYARGTGRETNMVINCALHSGVNFIMLITKRLHNCKVFKFSNLQVLQIFKYFKSSSEVEYQSSSLQIIMTIE